MWTELKVLLGRWWSGELGRVKVWLSFKLGIRQFRMDCGIELMTSMHSNVCVSRGAQDPCTGGGRNLAGRLAERGHSSTCGKLWLGVQEWLWYVHHSSGHMETAHWKDGLHLFSEIRPVSSCLTVIYKKHWSFRTCGFGFPLESCLVKI